MPDVPPHLEPITVVFDGPHSTPTGGARTYCTAFDLHGCILNEWTVFGRTRKRNAEAYDTVLTEAAELNFDHFVAHFTGPDPCHFHTRSLLQP